MIKKNGTRELSPIFIIKKRKYLDLLMVKYSKRYKHFVYQINEAGVSNMSKSTKLTIWFFVGYVLLIGSLISTVALVDFDKNTSPIKITESNTTFKQELTAHERKVEEKKSTEQKKPLPFTVSDEFVMTAVTLGAILDIVIVVLWARKENKRLAEKELPSKKRWRDTKIFWNIVALGMIQPKNNQYSINWFNLIGVTIFLHLLFYL